MDDLISRSELIEELKRFRDSLGSVFFRVIVDRVIERVAEQPTAEVNL